MYTIGLDDCRPVNDDNTRRPLVAVDVPGAEELVDDSEKVGKDGSDDKMIVTPRGKPQRKVRGLLSKIKPNAVLCSAISSSRKLETRVESNVKIRS